jgi:GPH family glycoside/pentoside/hexuronide:cation symporter
MNSVAGGPPGAPSGVRPPRLGLATKVSYGLGSLAQGVGAVTLSTAIINYYLVGVVGLRPALVGAIILVSLIVDAVLDPAIGRVSDTFRSRWGRRHPFMYASAIPVTLATFFLWRNPGGLTGGALAIYAMVVLVVLRVSGSLYQIPSDALAPELAPDYHERTGLLSWRWFFGLVGALGVSIILNVVFLRKDAHHPLGQNDPAAYANFGALAAAICLFSIVASAIATQRYVPFFAPQPVRRQTAAQSAREIFAILTNRSLLAVMASGLFSGVATGINNSLLGFMNFYFWGLTPQTVGWITLLSALAAPVGVIAAPLLARALDKKRTMITVFLLSIFAGVIPVTLRLMGLMPPNGSPWIPYILAADLFVWGALALIGAVIISSMIADVAEDSAVKTGVRSEGLLFAANGLLPKITAGVGAVIGNLMLEFVHFPAGALRGATLVDPAVMRNLALVSLPSGAILNLLSLAVLGFYRIDKRSHDANLEALRQASGGAIASTTPATGGVAIDGEISAFGPPKARKA